MRNRVRVAVVMLLTACGFPRPADVGDDDADGFTITLDAGRIRIVEGASASVTVSVKRNGVTDALVVTVGGLPTGITAEPVTLAGESGTLTLHAAVGAIQGDAALMVTVAGASISHEVALSLLVMGAPGTLDHSFGAGGMSTIPGGGRGNAIAVQPDGKIVVAGVRVALDGSKVLMVMRFLPDGTIDPSFSGGTAMFNVLLDLETRVSMALQVDGKIVVATMVGHRSTEGLIVRLNADGSHDNAFGAGGEESFTLPGAQFTNVMAVAVQDDSSVVVAGDTDNQAYVARFTPAGMLDSNFNTTGYAIVTGLGSSSRFLAVALQPDGRIVAAGSETSASDETTAVFARFDRAGRLDNSFSGDGVLASDICGGGNFRGSASIAFQRDGKIVVAGGAASFSSDVSCLVRLVGNDGTLDGAFSVGGAVLLAVGYPNFTTGLALQPDGKFIMAGGAIVGGAPSAFVARLATNGRPDAGFGNDGLAMQVSGSTSNQFQAAALDADGRIVATGFRTGSPDEILLYRLWP